MLLPALLLLTACTADPVGDPASPGGDSASPGRDSGEADGDSGLPPPAEVPPTWGSPVAVADDAVWAVAREAGELTRCDLALDSCEHFPLCIDVGQLAIDGDHIAVTCPLEGQLVLFDRTSLEQVGRLSLGTGTWPFGVAGHDGRWWVALQGTGEVVRVADGAEDARVAGLYDARALALSVPSPGSDVRVYVSRWRSAPTGGEIYVLDGDSMELQESLALALQEGVDSDTTTRGVPNLVEQLALTPDGGSLLVPALHSNILRGEYRDGQALAQDQALRAVVGVVDLDGGTGAGTSEQRKQLDERGRTLAVIPSPSGDRLYALHPGAEAVTVLDRFSLDVQGAVIDIGHGPAGLAISDDGQTLYVHAWLSRELRAYDLSPLPSSPILLSTAPLAGFEPLSETQLRGKVLFWTSADTRITRSNYIACAHCHPDGQDDGQVWDFTDRGEGLRKTLSLMGLGTGADTADPALGIATGRLHWSGNFDEVQDFENDIRNHFGGSGLLDDADWAETEDTLGEAKEGRSEDLDALATFVHGLVDPLVSPFPWSKEGEALFHEVGCTDCHPPPEYTDSVLDSGQLDGGIRHDVGTLTAASGQRLGGELDGLDTPTLVGTWARGPWLHDGSAATLEASIVAHDSAADLDEATVSAIADFLRAL